MRIIVAGFGNVLRADDGFGVAVAEQLDSEEVPAGVSVMDVGIGGIHLVQRLLDRDVDALVVVDAVDVDRPPGTVVVIDPEIVDVRGLPLEQRRDELADMHYATPARALMLGRALDVLPPEVVMIGCQPRDADTPHRGLSEPVREAVPRAAEEVRRLVTELGVAWGSHAAGSV